MGRKRKKPRTRGSGSGVESLNTGSGAKGSKASEMGRSPGSEQTEGDLEMAEADSLSRGASVRRAATVDFYR